MRCAISSLKALSQNGLFHQSSRRGAICLWQGFSIRDKEQSCLSLAALLPWLSHLEQDNTKETCTQSGEKWKMCSSGRVFLHARMSLAHKKNIATSKWILRVACGHVVSVIYTVRSEQPYHELQGLVFGDRISVYPHFSNVSVHQHLWQKQQKAALLGLVGRGRRIAPYTQTLHNHHMCKHVARLAVKAQIIFGRYKSGEADLHWWVSVVYITMCLLCRGDSLEKPRMWTNCYCWHYIISASISFPGSRAFIIWDLQDLLYMNIVRYIQCTGT